MIGEKFGMLTVVSINNEDARGKSYLCKCDCGNTVVLHKGHLLGYKSRKPNKSCGCSQKKQDGLTLKYPRIYNIHKQMIYRCYKDDRENYERYGGKGVKVCEEWLSSFQSFLDWALVNGYKDGLTIDRIDYSKDYGPDNCKWSDYYEQAQNKGISKDNKTGITGVCFYQDGKYRAYIARNDNKKHLGVFNTLQEAAKARREAEIKFKKTGTL